jgi:3-hydroxyisobutyrate dehydrogenase
MGKQAFLTGRRGNGLIAKLCNNALLATNILMLSKCYASTVKDINPMLLSEIFNSSTGGSWANEYYCPVPDIVQSAPSSHSYENGFDLSLMIKDLKLAFKYFQEPAELKSLFSELICAFENTRSFIGNEPKDFSIIFEYFLKLNRSERSDTL